MLKTRPKPNSALRLFKNFSVIEEQLSAFSATEAGNLKGKKKKKNFLKYLKEILFPCFESLALLATSGKKMLCLCV